MTVVVYRSKISLFLNSWGVRGGGEMSKILVLAFRVNFASPDFVRPVANIILPLKDRLWLYKSNWRSQQTRANASKKRFTVTRVFIRTDRITLVVVAWSASCFSFTILRYQIDDMSNSGTGAGNYSSSFSFAYVLENEDSLAMAKYRCCLTSTTSGRTTSNFANRDK